MTQPIGLFYDALKKIEEAREELEKGLATTIVPGLIAVCLIAVIVTVWAD